MIADNVRDLRALLREAAHALSAPLSPYDHSLSARLWAAHDALTVDALNHPAIPDGPDLKTVSTAPIPAHRDDRRDHDRHQPRTP